MRGGCTPGMPASCVPQGRKGPDKTSGADVRDRLDQARHKPPPQGAKRQRRHSAGAWPDGPIRGTGRKAARAVSGRQTRVRGRGRLLQERNQKGSGKTNGADVRDRLDQARHKPPVSPAGSVGPGRSPLGTRTPRRELPGVQPPRTCVSVLHRRERQLAAPGRDLLSPSTDGLRWENEHLRRKTQCLCGFAKMLR